MDTTDVQALPRELIVKKIRQWGDITTDAILDKSCLVFTMPGLSGFIGYRCESGCAVVMGSPICDITEQENLVLAFHEFCKKNSLKVVHALITREFCEWLMQKQLAQISIEFGEKIIMDPHAPPMEHTGPKASLVRRKVKHALNEGTVIQEHQRNDPKIEALMEEAGRKWLKSRKGPQVHISNVQLFTDRFGKRWFYAVKGGILTGLLQLNKLEKNEGWLLNHLMITPEASNGTPELLVVATLEQLAKENCSYVTTGIIPLTKLGKIEGMSSFGVWATRLLYQLAKRVFHLDGHRKFWEKFHPKTDPCFLAFSEKNMNPRMLIGLMKALNVTV